jgi:hypothetical protein
MMQVRDEKEDTKTTLHKGKELSSLITTRKDRL